MTYDEIRRRLDTLHDIVNSQVCFTMHQYDDTYVSKTYLGSWYADIELPHIESLDFDVLLKIAEHLGTRTLNFQSATEHGYYGEVDNIVRLWACWPEGK